MPKVLIAVTHSITDGRYQTHHEEVKLIIKIRLKRTRAKQKSESKTFAAKTRESKFRYKRKIGRTSAEAICIHIYFLNSQTFI